MENLADSDKGRTISRKAEKKGPKGIFKPLGPSRSIILEPLLHRAPKKVRG
jgi:hypothetical protein